MEMDKSGTILEAQWMEREIPRIEQELTDLQEAEQALLTAPLETVRQAYTAAYRAERQKAHRFYHRRRSVKSARQGYRTRNREVGWFSLLARILIVVAAVAAVYLVWESRQQENIQSGLIWGSVLLLVALGLAFVPALADLLWERRARQTAEAAAEEARQSPEFLQEKQDRQVRLQQCRARIADLHERLGFARIRLDELRKDLTSSNHGGDLVL
jgi:hypothetical protein